MAKRYVRITMIGFCVLVFAAACAYLVYMGTSGTSEESASVFSRAEQPALAESPRTGAEALPAAEFYLARVSGETLGIYACTGGREEFLYTLSVRIEDIPKEELSLLSRGIVLTDKESLAIFEEDFTS